jgi:hypothetical protein
VYSAPSQSSLNRSILRSRGQRALPTAARCRSRGLRCRNHGHVARVRPRCRRRILRPGCAIRPMPARPYRIAWLRPLESTPTGSQGRGSMATMLASDQNS